MVIGWLESELRFFLPTNRRLGAAVSVVSAIVYIRNAMLEGWSLEIGACRAGRE